MNSAPHYPTSKRGQSSQGTVARRVRLLFGSFWFLLVLFGSFWFQEDFTSSGCLAPISLKTESLSLELLALRVARNSWLWEPQ